MPDIARHIFYTNQGNMFRKIFNYAFSFLRLIMFIAFYQAVAVNQAHAINLSASEECRPYLQEGQRGSFSSPADEKNYFSHYHSCWAESVVLQAAPARHHYLGKGLELFSHPEYVDALGFSKLMCQHAGGSGMRGDFPCWFEADSMQGGASVEEAVKKESPKVLFTTLIQSRGKNDTDKVEYVLCLNDDPTKPKEYSKGCRRGLKMEISEYGRGDINGDGVEDIVVRISYGINLDTRRRCYIAVYTRKNAELLKLLTYTPPGLCQ